MFGIKKGKDRILVPDVGALACDSEVARYIRSLETEIQDLRNTIFDLRQELDSIRPVFDKTELKPAVSEYCETCKYCVRTRLNRAVIGCCKDITCEDYVPNEEKEK